MPLSYDFAALKTKVDSLDSERRHQSADRYRLGMAIARPRARRSMRRPRIANYTYKKVLIVMSDGLNTQDRWPSTATADPIQRPDRRPPANPVRQHQG